MKNKKNMRRGGAAPVGQTITPKQLTKFWINKDGTLEAGTTVPSGASEMEAKVWYDMYQRQDHH